MANANRSVSAERAGRIIVRLFFIVLAGVLLLTGYDHYAPLVFGNDKPLYCISATSGSTGWSRP